MTTIKQLSEELGVSKQAIYNRITKEPLKTILGDIEGAVQTNTQGTIFLSEAGENIIRNAYDEKYRRPGDTPGNSPVHGKVVVARAELDDSKLDSIIFQLNNVQASLDSFAHQLSTRDVQIENLQTQVRERDAKIIELSRTAKKLTDFATSKEAEIQALKDSYNQAQAAELREQPAPPKTQITPDDTNEPEQPTTNNQQYDNQQPNNEPQNSEQPDLQVSTTEEEAPPPPQESVKQITSIPTSRHASIQDLYEPLTNLLSDSNTPTARFSSLAIKD